MKKFITTLCLILCLIMVASTFGCTDKEWKVGYAGGEVSSNGGFCVEVGDYIYFINGIATATDNNDFGNPVKGSLVRMKKSELANPQEATSAEVVVPKLFASSYYEAGVTIVGDYVYYGSPNSDTNKKGEVLNSQIVFYKTKLDGTGTKKILTCDSLAQEYKFVTVGEQVYLIVVNSKSVDNSSTGGTSETTYTLKVYNANSGAEIFVKEDADSYVLPAEINCLDNAGYIFFTDKIKDENEQDKEYNALYAYKLGEDKAGILFNGAIVDDGSFGTKGYLFTTIKFANGLLYFSDYNVNSSEANLFFYFIDVTNSAVKILDSESATFDADNKANYNLKVELKDTLGATVSKAIVKNSVYNSKNEIVYYQDTVGLISYNYEGDAELLVYASKLTSATSPVFKGIFNGYAYFVDSTSMVYRINIGDSTAKLTKITPASTNTNWYNIEVVTVDGVDYLLLNLNTDPYYNYVYALEADVEAKIARENAQDLPDVTATDYQEKLDEMVEKYFKDIENKDEDALMALVNRKIGKVSSADKNALNSYISTNYSSSSSSN